MGLFSPIHLVILGVLALFLFGPNKLPEMGRQLGKGMRDFREAIDGTGIKEALDSVNDVRTAVSPTNMARTFVPGVSDTQDAFSAAREAVSLNETPAPESGDATAESAAAAPAASAGESPTPAPQP